MDSRKTSVPPKKALGHSGGEMARTSGHDASASSGDGHKHGSSTKSRAHLGYFDWVMDGSTSKAPTVGTPFPFPFQRSREPFPPAPTPVLGVDPPRPPKEGCEWVWFPEGYWAEREFKSLGSVGSKTDSKSWRRRRKSAKSQSGGGDKDGERLSPKARGFVPTIPAMSAPVETKPEIASRLYHQFPSLSWKAISNTLQKARDIWASQFPGGEATRVHTPPLKQGTADGKTRGLFFDVNGPTSDQGDKSGSTTSTRGTRNTESTHQGSSKSSKRKGMTRECVKNKLEIIYHGRSKSLQFRQSDEGSSPRFLVPPPATPGIQWVEPGSSEDTSYFSRRSGTGTET
ncbi:hypothetical protein B0T24DRAFT_696047 [Lasiosphaeria ovina]|uniref:Uncharacterized protein n=1 Tax=Lasiosphaeria ovina TaxID=92902 RepID=A0AAE0NEB6_9PEZI|nr:hypothetical protein B0T24DRAFT_696047 [Lasiosphaeria ovina]